MNKPVVRYLNVQPFQDRFLISDPLGLTEPLIVTRELLFIMSLMDGSRDEREIRAEFFKRTGLLLSEQELKEVLELLDKNYLLLNENFAKKLETLREEALKRDKKPPFHAGEAYPKDPKELEKFIDGSLEGERKERAVGILVPHMDLRVALPTYGKVYGSLNVKPDLVLILGVSHYHHEMPLSVLPVDLETPLGILEVDKELAVRLNDLFDFDLFHDVLSYEREHSVEFQTIFVKRLFPEAKALPMIISYGEPEQLEEFADKIASLIKDRDVLVISSVDMSHVGKKFGDPASYDPSDRDREYLSLLEEMKSEEAYRLLASDGNRTRIDGQFTNYVFLEVIKRLGANSGKLLDYDIYHEEPTDSKVSYAGMVFS